MDKGKIVVFLTDTRKLSSSDDSDSSFVKNTFSDYNNENDEDNTLLFPLVSYVQRSKRKRTDSSLYLIQSWTDNEFKDYFKISRQTAHRLIDDLQKSGHIATHKFGVKPLGPDLCFYIFLTFMSSNEPLIQIATKFDISISSTFRVIRRVISWLLTKLNDAIRWPTEVQSIKQMGNLFYTKTKIPNVIGVIDCLHIKIDKPKNARHYCNAKGYFSVILQATVDANLKFTNVYCGEPGSFSSFRVLKKSPLYSIATKNKNLLFPNNTYLLGHSRYPSLSWLVQPYRDNKRLTLSQREFNSLHASARKISEKAFYLLKSRFKRLKLFSTYRNICFIIDTIVAACILHNYCISENENDKCD